MMNKEFVLQSELEEIKREEYIESLEKTKWHRNWISIKRNWQIYVMLIPVILFFFLFRYKPIGELLVAFKKHDPGSSLSTFESPFYGFYALKLIMFGPDSWEFWRAFRNTFTISTYGLLFGFPMPIVLALLFSEIKSEAYRSITQILTYLPKFISTVVVTSLIFLMLHPGDGNQVQPGVINQLLSFLGVIEPGGKVLESSKYFRSIYILSGIWSGAGYGSIVYFAAIMAISPTNYEAAKIDGANKLAQIRYVTFPGMAPTLTIMLILRIGQILNVGYEEIMLLSQFGGNGQVLESSEVLSTYVLKMGALLEGQVGGAANTKLALATSADLFNSFIAMFLVLGANFISKKVSDNSLF